MIQSKTRKGWDKFVRLITLGRCDKEGCGSGHTTDLTNGGLKQIKYNDDGSIHQQTAMDTVNDFVQSSADSVGDDKQTMMYILIGGGVLTMSLLIFLLAK